MIITLLQDLSEGTTDAVIISKNSTSEEIQEKINEAKEQKEYDWQWEDLEEALPGDCEIVTCWSGNLNKIYY